MGIRVKGSNPKNYTAEVILQAAIDQRKRDIEYGIPLHVIILDWNPQKKCYHQSNTKGDIDDVFIERLPQGGITVTYRNPGSLEWLKDGLTGDFTARCAVTKRNLNFLASNYYDRQWTIRDQVIDAQVKKIADQIDEENKNIPTTFTKIRKKIGKNGKWEIVEETIESNMYEFHKQRREANFRGPTEIESITPTGMVDHRKIEKGNVDILTKKRELDERERELNRREKDAGIIPDLKTKKTDYQVEPQSGFTAEELGEKKIGELRKLATEQFKIENTFKKTKAQIVAEISEIQNTNTLTETEPVVEESITS